jgi:hypothetical protein
LNWNGAKILVALVCLAKSSWLGLSSVPIINCPIVFPMKEKLLLLTLWTDDGK